MVIDSSDKERLHISKSELHTMMESEVQSYGLVRFSFECCMLQHEQGILTAVHVSIPNIVAEECKSADIRQQAGCQGSTECGQDL